MMDKLDCNTQLSLDWYMVLRFYKLCIAGICLRSKHRLALKHTLVLFGNTTIQTFLSLKPPAWKYLADENTTADAKIENPQNNFKPR